MQKTLVKMSGVLGLALLLPACVKRSAAVQASVPEQDSLIEIYEEPTALPLNSLYEKLSDKVGAQMPKTRTGLFIPPPKFVACGETVSIPGTHLCIFSNKDDMNFALNRASQWVEAKEMLDHTDLMRINSRQNVLGHNISGKDLKEFSKAYAQVKDGFDQNLPEQFAKDIGTEREFWSRFLQKKVDSAPNLYLLAIIYGSSEGLSHESFHALYYSSPKMQKLIKDFWLQELSQSERVDIISEIAMIGGYDVGADDPMAPSHLLLQEFQAYVLMERSEFSDDKLKAMAMRYQQRLQLLLTNNGIQLPTIGSKASK